MNKLLKVMTPALGVIFLVLFALSVKTMTDNPLLQSNHETAGTEKSYHYAFFLPSSEYSFFRELEAGASAAAQNLDCAISFHSVSSDSLSLAMAAYSGIDGIAVFLYEKDERTLSALGRIADAAIPVIQIENEIVSGSATYFIGTNSFDSGKSIGKIALKTERPSVNLALIYSDKNPGLKADANLVEMGLKSVSGDRIFSLFTTTTSSNTLDAERVIYELLQQVPAIDIIALTDTNDTFVAIQAIIDLNLVGQVQLIGFGDDTAVKDYIEKGVVLGSIVRNPYRIGYSAVMALKEISANGYTSAYVDTGITVLTKNSGMFLRNGGP